ncbi:unnamed protein product [Durusdinium trenchii]|uniref:Uncharacterized protein n=1 Tax=Durusdinium trenchii TaxID=1381693 RepID=A0ABP0L6X0_9DINO
MAPWPLLLAAITSTTSAWAAQIAVAPKHILVTGGIMKSHQLSLVPIIEALLERGHQVTFVLPNSSEAHGWFPEGIGRARLLHLGPEDGGIESIKIPDMKNLAAHQKIAAFLEYLWNYRRMVDKPLFGVTDDLKKLLEQSSFDVAFASSITLGCTQVLSRSGLPWIGFMSISAQPEFVIQDTDLLCNYPNMVNPRSLNELKESLWMRVQNRIECKLLHAYTYFVAWMLNGMLRDRGFRKAPNVIDLLMAAPINVMLGGPPLQLPMQLPAKVQVVGVVERATPRPLPSELAAWLGDHEKTVLYISMGTKYELSREICQKLVEILRRLQNDSLRILWSLRPQQQELLQDLLPSPSSTMRIEASHSPWENNHRPPRTVEDPKTWVLKVAKTARAAGVGGVGGSNGRQVKKKQETLAVGMHHSHHLQVCQRPQPRVGLQQLLL